MNAPLSSNLRSTLAESSTLAAEWKKDLDVGLIPRLSRCREMYDTLEHTHQVVLSQRDEIERLRTALEHPATLGHEPKWEIVSGASGPRQRCLTCGWLGLPVERPSGVCTCGRRFQSGQIHRHDPKCPTHGSPRPADETSRCQHDLLAPNPTVSVSPDGSSAGCYVCKKVWQAYRPQSEQPTQGCSSSITHGFPVDKIC